MSSSFEPGFVLLKKYRIENPIEKGGFGTVYLATDVRLKRLVAIKMLSYTQTALESRFGSGTFDEFLSRFQHEAEISSYFTSNPNIITVYSLEQDDNNDYYLVMEYLDGGSLSGLLKKHGPLPTAKICSITLDVCHALAEVHSHPADIVHRDLKPNNILLRRNGQAILADFGVAQIGSESHRTLFVGQHGKRHPGSPAYKSPEQDNDYSYLSPASDLYSLGLVMYEMVTGKVYRKIRRLPPSREVKELPAWLDEIIIKLLQEKIEDRYQQAEEVAAAIRVGIKRQHTEQEDTTPVSQAFSEAPRPEGRRQTKKDRRADEKEDTEIARRERELDEAFKRISENPSKPYQFVEFEETRLLQIQEAEKKANQEREAQEASQHQIRLAQQINEYLAQLEHAERLFDWDTAIQMGQMILDLDSNHELSRSKTANALSDRAFSYLNKGDSSRAVADANRAIELEPNQPKHYLVRGNSYFQQGDNERAITDYTSAIKLDPSQPIYYYQRGQAYQKQIDYHRAIDDLKRAIDRDPRQAQFYFTLGQTYDLRGTQFYNKNDQEQALVNFEQAIQRDPNQPNYYFQHGLGLVKLTQYQRAWYDFEQAIQRDPTRPEYYFQRGRCFVFLKDYDRALNDMDQAIQRNPNNANFYFWRGLIYKARGNKKAAKQNLETATQLGHPEARRELDSM